MTERARVETRFGVFDVNPGDVIRVPGGLPGFEQCRRYVVVTSPPLEPFTCLQGLDDSRPSFLALDPKLVVPDYGVPLSPADRHRLEAGEGEPLLWLALVRLDADAVLANLGAPVVVNPRRMIGIQAIPADTPYAIDHRVPLG